MVLHTIVARFPCHHAGDGCSYWMPVIDLAEHRSEPGPPTQLQADWRAVRIHCRYAHGEPIYPEDTP